MPHCERGGVFSASGEVCVDVCMGRFSHKVVLEPATLLPIRTLGGKLRVQVDFYNCE